MHGSQENACSNERTGVSCHDAGNDAGQHDTPQYPTPSTWAASTADSNGTPCARHCPIVGSPPPEMVNNSRPWAITA